MTDLAKDITWTCGIGNISANGGQIIVNGSTALTKYNTVVIKGTAANGVSISATLDVSPGM